MKRLLSLLLVLAMSLSLLCTVSAASPEATEAADALHDLGLFQGVGTNQDGTPKYDLDRAPNRYEAVTMLVRLLGKEEEAKAGTWKTPFKDVAEWAKPYVGYAYQNKLTSGISADKFGGTGLVTASQYITFVLRALGYDSSTDFKWDAAWELSDKVGFTSGEYNASSAFTRGDVAIISYRALSAKTKGAEQTLQEALKQGSATSTPAQAVTQEDLVGVWHGTNSYGVRFQTYFWDDGRFAEYTYNEAEDFTSDMEGTYILGDGNLIYKYDFVILSLKDEGIAFSDKDRTNDGKDYFSALGIDKEEVYPILKLSKDKIKISDTELTRGAWESDASGKSFYEMVEQKLISGVTDNAFDFLKRTSEKLGKKDNNGNYSYFFMIDKSDGGTQHQFYIEYRPEKDVVRLVLSSFPNDTRDVFTAIDLTRDSSKPYSIGIVITKTQENQTESAGAAYIDASKFMNGSALYFYDYLGPSEMKSIDQDLASDGCYLLIGRVTQELLEPNGYTEKDLGFTHFREKAPQNEGTSQLSESDKQTIRTCIATASNSAADGLQQLLNLSTYDMQSMMATGSAKAQYDLLKTKALNAFQENCGTSKTAINKILATCKNKSGTEVIVTNANKALACCDELLKIKTIDPATLEKALHLCEDLVTYLTNISNEVNK